VVILGYPLADLPTQLEPAKYERMIFGIILVLMMIFRPQGILPAKRRQREIEMAAVEATPERAGTGAGGTGAGGREPGSPRL
jgi:branched-chain amino acid transport system permease protein